MALEKLRLTLNPSSDNYQYDVSMLREVTLRSNKQALSIAPPGLASHQNILLGVSGMEADLQVSFSVHDDGTDKANGTAPLGVFTNDTVVTVEEQLEWLEDYIHAPDFDAKWELDHLTGAAFNADDVFLETIDVPLISRESPKWKPCRLSIRRGQAV